jgi:hypothetical protein
MTEPILKLDSQPEEPEPPKLNGAVRWLVLGAALAALFAGVVMAMLFALPKPHTQSDYMIAGGLATMITMLALFGALLSTTMRDPQAFYKRRPK